MEVYSVNSLRCSNIRYGCIPCKGLNITDNNHNYRLFYVELSAKSLCLAIRFLPKYKRPIVKF